jgi:hypothetical protein
MRTVLLLEKESRGITQKNARRHGGAYGKNRQQTMRCGKKRPAYGKREHHALLVKLGLRSLRFKGKIQGRENEMWM